MHDEWIEARDREHLNLLAIFNFVAAALFMLPLLVILGILVVVNIAAFSSAGQPSAEPVPYASAAILLVWAIFTFVPAAICFLNGLYLRRIQARTFSIVVAALQCFAFPVGTALGVFTIVVLARPSVVDLYEEPSIPAIPS